MEFWPFPARQGRQNMKWRASGHAALAACVGALVLGASSAAAAEPETKAPPVRCERQPRGTLAPGGVRMVEVNGHAWAYREKGTGPTALLITPAMGDSTLYLEQLNGLKDIRRMIAPDLLGFGHSEPSTAKVIDPYAYARDFICLLDAIGVEDKVDIVGMSMGAFMAGLIYEMAPERVRSLTIISGTFEFQKNLPYERYQHENARNVVVEGRDMLFRRFDEYIQDKSAALPARARYKDMIQATPHNMIVASMYSFGRNPSRADLYAKIKVPVLLPIGKGDVLFSTNYISSMARKFPDATVVELDSAGRLLPLEAPEQFNKALRDFWARLDARQPG
jgi:3-oxoadipate enol-lactonase